MKKFTITKNFEDGTKYVAYHTSETEQEALEWAASQNHLGVKDVDWHIDGGIDVSTHLSNKSLITAFESEISSDEAYACEMVMKHITKLNKDKAFTAEQKDAMMADSELSAILQMLMVAKRPSRAKGMISAYASTTYYSAEEKQAIVDYLAAKGY